MALFEILRYFRSSCPAIFLPFMNNEEHDDGAKPFLNRDMAIRERLCTTRFVVLSRT